MKSTLKALALALCLGAWAQGAAAQTTDPSEQVAANQRAFEAGARALMAQDYATAVQIFEPLADATGAPRVRLELARALFLSGEYRRARSEFLKVYHDPNLPYPVRRTINVFLDDIDERIGYVRPQLGVVFDTNPGRSATSGFYDVLGIPLEYVAPEDSQAAGISYQIEALRPLSTGSPWAITGAIAGAAYEGGVADYTVGALAIRYSDHVRRATYGAGVRTVQNRNLTSYSPYVEYSRRRIVRPGRQTNFSASIEANRYDGADDLDGATVRLGVLQARDLNGRLTLSGGFGASASTARNSVFPEYSGVLSASLGAALPRINKNLVLTASETVSRYGRRDVFFGEIRQDFTTKLETSLYTGRPVFGLFPGVTVSYERRHSNIDFYRYSQTGLALELRRRF